MKARLKKKWVEALISGEYEQGQKRLRKKVEIIVGDDVVLKDQYCCLGVLCDVAGVRWRRIQDFLRDELGEFETSGNVAVLSDALQKKFGISQAACSKLMRMNDSGNKTFKQIASYIKRYV